jgi:spore germination protein GerM
MVNRETISGNFTIIAQRLNLPPFSGSEDKSPEPEPLPAGADGLTVRPSAASQSAPVSQAAPAAEQTPPRPEISPAAPVTPNARPAPGAAAEKTAARQSTRSTTQPPAAKSVETRERNLYFTQVDKDGAIVRSRVTRKITVSDSPMQDSLKALIAGPTAEEQRRGVVNLIPRNTRILSATVRGNTAYISFSEDFQYNTYGVEGYAAQLRQIVWTATEFPNVKDVQILIEGRRMDYLGEGLWIGSPVNRDSL